MHETTRQLSTGFCSGSVLTRARAVKAEIYTLSNERRCSWAQDCTTSAGKQPSRSSLWAQITVVSDKLRAEAALPLASTTLTCVLTYGTRPKEGHNVRDVTEIGL